MKTASAKKYLIGIFFIWTIVIALFFIAVELNSKQFVSDLSVKEEVSKVDRNLAVNQFITNHKKKDYFLFSALWLMGVLGSFLAFKLISKEQVVSSELKSSLKNSDEKFKQYFDDNLAIMLLVDPITKNIFDANNAAVKFYGYSKEQFLKMKIYDVNTIPSEEIDAKMKKAIMQKSNHLSFMHKLFNNKTRDVEVYASPFLIDNKKVMSVIVHDVTKQKNTERELIRSKNCLQETSKLLETLFNAVPDVISVVDNNFNVMRYNKAGYDFLNLTYKQTVGKKHYELMGCELPDERCATSKVYNAKKPIKVERYDEKLKGWFEARAYPILDDNNEVFQVIEFLQDITERKHFIDELKKAKEKAEESDQLKSSFLANMSHEIRTPMNAILGFTELLLADDITVQNKEKYVKIIQNSGNHLLDIINDIIDISKIDAQQTSLHETDFNLNILLIEIYQFFQALILEKGNGQVQLILDNDNLENQNFIYTDKKRLKQVLINLVGNAIKFTDKGSVAFGYEIKNESSIIFSIKDTGIGMSEEELLFVFDRFRQGDETYKRVFGGTGLGLAISKEFVELLGGTIWVNSVKEEGTTFNFTVPYQQIAETELTESELIAKVETSNISKLKDKTILIVEDEEYSLLVLEEMMKINGAKTLAAEDGLQAIQACVEHKEIDLILMDIQMPKLDGIEATQRIRKIYPNLPIIAQTAHAMPEERQKTMSKGFTDYLTKPIDKDELFAMIEKYIA